MFNYFAAMKCHVIFLCVQLMSTVSGMVTGDSPQRQKRDAVNNGGVAGLPDMNSLLQNQNTVQAAYFLGQCLMCPPGPQGPPGQTGAQGPPGRDGRDGILVGFPSTADDTDQTPPSVDSPVNTNGSTPVGAVYTRWGRSSCPDGAELVYEGVMAGSHYSHAGGAADYLCLSKAPIFDRPQPGHQYGGYLYGTEYETGGSPLLPNLQNLEAPCAVCLAPSKAITLMVPGRNQCPEGSEGKTWRLEYNGYIMSQHHTHPRTLHVCVDSQAEGIVRTHGDHNGALLYHVETSCTSGGGLPCPPYADGFEVTCAVCSL